MGKKAKKGKLPKEVFGVKLPKELRRAGDQLIEQATSGAGQKALAGALTMAAAAATAALARGREPAGESPRSADATEAPGATDAPHAQGTQRSPDPQAIADIAGQAVEAVIGRVFGKKG